jgi:hypothetical protein
MIEKSPLELPSNPASDALCFRKAREIAEQLQSYHVSTAERILRDAATLIMQTSRVDLRSDAALLDDIQDHLEGK